MSLFQTICFLYFFSCFGKLATIFLLKIFVWVDKMGGTRFWRGMQQKNWTLFYFRGGVHSPACPPTMSTEQTGAHRAVHVKPFIVLGRLFGRYFHKSSKIHIFLVVSESILQFVGFESVPIGLGVVCNLFQTPIPGMRRIWRPMWYLDWQERVVWHPQTSGCHEPTRFLLISNQPFKPDTGYIYHCHLILSFCDSMWLRCVTKKKELLDFQEAIPKGKGK